MTFREVETPPLEQLNVEKHSDENMTIVWHDGVPLVTFLPGGVLLTTDKRRTNEQRQHINACIYPIGRITPDWMIRIYEEDFADFYDGIFISRIFYHA